MGMVSDIISTFAAGAVRLSGHDYSIAGIAGLGFIVWGHHMFSPAWTRAWAPFHDRDHHDRLPSAVKFLTGWARPIAAICSSRRDAVRALVRALFIIGGSPASSWRRRRWTSTSTTPISSSAHIHYVLFTSSLMGIFGAIYYWFPKMFARFMNEFWGKVHFFLSFTFANASSSQCTFSARQACGGASGPNRDRARKPAAHAQSGDDDQRHPLGLSQIIFVINFLFSFLGRECAERNPWHSNTLEWSAPTPPLTATSKRRRYLPRPYEYGEVPAGKRTTAADAEGDGPSRRQGISLMSVGKPMSAAIPGGQARQKTNADGLKQSGNPRSRPMAAGGVTALAPRRRVLTSRRLSLSSSAPR